MIKINIVNMKEFLKTVDECGGKVERLYPDGRKEDLKRGDAREKLKLEYQENKRWAHVALNVSNPKDYMRVVFFTVGDS